MWLIADFFKRYTETVSRTFVRLMAAEAETNRKILAASRDRRARSNLATRSKAAVQTVKDEAVADAAKAAAPAAHVPEIKPVAAPEEKPTAAPEEKAMAPADGLEMPMGVRGDVVAGWLERLAAADKSDAPALLESLRKDKKVRVAELRMICSMVLGEPPQNRKKAEYLAVLSGHFAPAERSRTTDDGGNGVHAA